MQRLHLAIAAALGLASGALSAQTDASFSDFDSNNDGQISREEFRSTVGESSLYSDRDENQDQRIDENEFDAMEFDAEQFQDWDADNDLYLDEDEFYQGVFIAFDANEDGHWDGNDWDDAGDEGVWDV